MPPDGRRWPRQAVCGFFYGTSSKSLLSISIASGILIFLHGRGIHIDRAIAAALNMAASPENLLALSLFFVGVAGFVLLSLFDVFDVQARIRRSFGRGSPSIPEIENLPQRGPRPDYDKWDKVDEFRLIDLAYLWEDMEPAGYPMSAAVRERFDQLAKRSDEQKLILSNKDDLGEVVRDAMDHVESGKPNPNWTASISDAKDYARAVDERPPFLFPQRRV